MGKAKKKQVLSPTPVVRAAMQPQDEKAHAELAEEWLDAMTKEEEPNQKDLAKEEPEERSKKAKEKEPNDELAELRALLQRLMDDLGIQDMQELSARIDQAEIQKLTEGYGLTGEAAQLFLAQQEKVRALRAAQKAAQREAEYASLSNDPLYADIGDKRAEIEAFILRTGVSPREAYGALYAEERLRSLLEEQGEKAAEKEKKAHAIPALSGGNAQEKPGHVRLSDAEIWAAERAGMTPTEYAKYKYSY
ncbi:MAG: hypothetical protein PUB07_02525 [Clostridia bacterium]|nr:hypothetical protein [Clostridia bacterium]